MATPTQYGRVERLVQLTPNMIRVILGGDGLAGFQPTRFSDQYINAQFVPEGAPYSTPFDVDAARSLPAMQRPRGRRITVREWDPVERLLTLDFVTHGDVGYAGSWVRSAQVGDLLQFLGPSGSYLPDPEADWYLLVGDETVLPAIAASLPHIPAGRPVVAMVLVDGPECELTLDCEADLTTIWLHRDRPGHDHDRQLRALEDLSFPEGRVDGFVHGEAGETRAVRRHLLADRNVAKEQLSASPYWRCRFSDEDWRQVKKAWVAEMEAEL